MAVLTITSDSKGHALLAWVVILQGTTEPHWPGGRCYLLKSSGGHVRMFPWDLLKGFMQEQDMWREAEEGKGMT